MQINVLRNLQKSVRKYQMLLYTFKIFVCVDCKKTESETQTPMYLAVQELDSDQSHDSLWKIAFFLLFYYKFSSS